MLDANWNGDLDSGGYKWEWESGIIAQDVMKIPELKHTVLYGDPNNADPNREYKKPHALKYNDIHCWSLAALQELDTKNTTLENKVQQLETKVQQHDMAIMALKVSLNTLLAAAN